VQINKSGIEDHVDRVRAQWAREQPELDTSPIAVIARLGRLHSYVDAALHPVFAEFGLTRQGWDVLASLRRLGPPYRLTPSELTEALMRTSGAVTHTLHRLEYAGLIERIPSAEDGRSLLVGLTEQGRELCTAVGPRHLANERRLLDPLSTQERETLAGLLRTVLLPLECGPARSAPAARPVSTGRRRRATRHSSVTTP
jgi:DNA-binding MarR family transcriptional regulator